MSPQITYRHLPPGVEPKEGARSSAEPLDIRHLESVEEMMGATLGDLIEVYDLRNGGEERSFKVVSVGRPTYSGFVEASSMALGNLNRRRCGASLGQGQPARGVALADV